MKLVSMVDFILDIDWLTTKEFCTKFNIPVPHCAGGVDDAVNQLLTIDAIKHRFFVEYAKILNKNLTADFFEKEITFNGKFNKDINSRGIEFFIPYKCNVLFGIKGFPILQIHNETGAPVMISKVSDLIPYGFSINYNPK